MIRCGPKCRSITPYFLAVENLRIQEILWKYELVYHSRLFLKTKSLFFSRGLYDGYSISYHDEYTRAVKMEALEC